MNYYNPEEDYELPEKEFDVDVNFVMFKEDTINTNEYEVDEGCEESMEDGELCKYGWHEENLLSGCNHSKTWEEQHYTPVELLEEYAEYLKSILNNIDTSTRYGKIKYNKLESKIKDCIGWKVDSIEI